MSIRIKNQFLRCGFALLCLVGLMLTAVPVRAQAAASPVPIATSAETNTTNRVTRNERAAQPVVTVPSPTKRKAGFIAGSGLAILSLLVLAAGLALVRTFKR